MTKNSDESVVVFIHGLSSTPYGTWSRMRQVCLADPTLPPLTLATYRYKTSLFHLPIGPRLASIQELADGLRTELNLRYAGAKTIILAGHSLGGVISRQFVLEEAKKGLPVDRFALALYAVPNLGSLVANIGSFFSPSHRHLRQLISQSDILTILNEDWVRLGLDKAIPARYVVGSGDRVVGPYSAKAFVGNQNVQTLVDHTHSDITQAQGPSDLRYLALKNLILDVVACPEPRNDLSIGNPLFEIYSIEDEAYYVTRDDDTKVWLHKGNTWIWGVSGVGKTSILRRLSLSDGAVIQVTLGGNRGASASDLVRTIAEMLTEGHVGAGATTTQILAIMRTALAAAAKKGPVTLLVEEIPLADQAEREAFSRHIIDLCMMLRDVTGANVRVRVALSSLYDPLEGVKDDQLKIGECLNVLEASPWSSNEIETLAVMLSRAVRPGLSVGDCAEIVSRSGGSPRVVKSLFRRWKFGTDKGMSVGDLLDAVLVDQVVR